MCALAIFGVAALGGSFSIPVGRESRERISRFKKACINWYEYERWMVRHQPAAVSCRSGKQKSRLQGPRQDFTANLTSPYT